MHVLVINAFPEQDEARCLVDVAVATLDSNGHRVSTVNLVDEDFDLAMTPAERAGYETDRNLLAAETQRSAQLLSQADAVLFCYPTVTHMVPAVLKGWYDRVLVPGVAFVLDSKGRVRPGMTNVVRLGAVTATPHGRIARLRHRDLGRRSIMRTLRLQCHRRCRRTFIRFERMESLDSAKVAVAAGFNRW